MPPRIELFPDRTSGVDFFENVSEIFFSGKGATNEVLSRDVPV